MNTQTKDWPTALANWLQKNSKTAPERLQRLREDFVRRFPIEYLKDIDLNHYAVGKPDSFCYWLEFKTKELGSISGGSAAPIEDIVKCMHIRYYSLCHFLHKSILLKRRNAPL